jgi:hypothetical protein
MCSKRYGRYEACEPCVERERDPVPCGRLRACVILFFTSILSCKAYLVGGERTLGVRCVTVMCMCVYSLLFSLFSRHVTDNFWNNSFVI